MNSKKWKILWITFFSIFMLFILCLCFTITFTIGYTNNGIKEFYGADHKTELHDQSDKELKNLIEAFNFPCESKHEDINGKAVYVRTYDTFDEFSIYCITDKKEQDNIVKYMQENFSKDRAKVVLFYESESWESFTTSEGFSGMRKNKEKFLRGEILNINKVSNFFTLTTLFQMKLFGE